MPGVQSITNLIARLPAIRLVCTLEAQAEARLPAYLGSTLRGALGSSLKQAVCTEGLRSCDGCHRQESCVYPLVFETPFATGEQEVKRMRDIPHPYVIEPPLPEPGHPCPWDSADTDRMPVIREGKRFWRPGDSLVFGLVLLGRGTGVLPYLIFALRLLAERGLGVNRHPFWLARVETETGQMIYDGQSGKILPLPVPDALADITIPESTDLSLSFHTPTRLVRKGLIDRKLLPENVVLNLARRMEALLHFHAQIPFSELDLRGLGSLASSITLSDSHLAFTDWERYSNRQKQKIQMGGMTGRVVWKNVHPSLAALLRAGEYLHVGKGAVMGMGRISVKSCSQQSSLKRKESREVAT